MTIPTFSTQPMRAVWSRVGKNRYATAVDNDDSRPYVWDIGDVLGSGETVASVDWETSGVTLSSKAVSGTAFGATATGAGSATAKVTTSAGEIINFTFEWRDPTYSRDGYR